MVSAIVPSQSKTRPRMFGGISIMAADGRREMEPQRNADERSSVKISRMPTTRRAFIASTAATVAVGVINDASGASATAADEKHVTREQLDRILDQPVLKTDFLTSPVTVASIELLRNGKTFIVRARSTDGVE